MIEISNKVDCSGCEACANVCPKQCITMSPDEEGFRYPVVEKSRCIECHLCEKICPIANEFQSDNQGISVYGAINKDRTIQKSSSSGGVFYELGRIVIEKYHGVVFGVKFSGTDNAIFDYAEDLEHLKPFLGSKYVQAKVNDVYAKAREFLTQGRTVLFSGTPCQIAGLRSYLQKEYDNLYTVDFICEGVPSEKLLNIFKSHYEKKYHSPIVNIEFRNKRYGWKYLGFLLTFASGKRIYLSTHEINYLFILFSFTYMRPSCYECRFRDLHSGSDIKLADFWEVKNSQHGEFDFYGVSHLFVNTKQGERLFQDVQDHFRLCPSSLAEAKRLNNTLNTQVFDTKRKQQFLSDIASMSDEEIYNLMDRYMNHNALDRLKFKVKIRLAKIKYAMPQKK